MLRFPPSGFTDRTAPRAGVSYASWLRRAVGLLIDGVIISMINYIIGGVLSLTASPVSTGLVRLFIFLSLFSVVAVTYDTLCLAKLHGQTPGMRVMQIRCVPVRGSGGLSMPQSFARAVTADLIVSVPWLFHYRYPPIVVVPLIAYLWPLVDQRRQTWWDHLAATVVLSEAW